jgi:hypothetical protein
MYSRADVSRIPTDVLEEVRKFCQPHACRKHYVPVVIVEGRFPNVPILDTVDGKTCAVVSKAHLCGNYYD